MHTRTHAKTDSPKTESSRHPFKRRKMNENVKPDLLFIYLFII